MVPPLVLDILIHHATRNVSPHTTLQIARLALLHRESHAEPIVTLAKNIVSALETEAWSTVVSQHPRIPPAVEVHRLLGLIPILQTWNTRIPQEILDLALHDAIVWEEPLENITCLIDAGARVNEIAPTCYFSPLMIAVRQQRVPLVKLLLERGADRDRTIDGHTASSFATSVQMRLLLHSS